MAYGLTSDGFIPKTLEEIKAAVEAKQRANIDAGLNQGAHTVIGQLNGIYAEEVRELWELAEAMYNSHNPDSAEDASLDNIAAICPGIMRNDAEYSTVEAIVNLDAGTTLPLGSVASVYGTSNARFATTVAVTNGNGIASDVSVVMQAESTGPYYAYTNTLTVIETPVSGWNSVTNPAAADEGANSETNTELRLRREQTIRLAGSCHAEAIKADVIEVENVINAIVIENDTDYVSNGMQPHSIQVFVWDGPLLEADNNTIATTIYESRAAGIYTMGNAVETVTDTMGFDHTIRFDRATQLPLYVTVDIQVDDDYAGNNAVEDSISVVANDYEIGDDVYASKIIGAVVDVEGIVDVQTVRLGWVPSPSGTTTLVVPYGSIAVLQSVIVNQV